MAKQGRSKAKRLIVLAAELAFLLLVAWGVRKTLHAAITDLGTYTEQIAWQFRPYWLAASGGLYLAGLLPMGLFWQRLMVFLGQPAKPLEALRAYYIGHLGKYVPGKALVVVLRTALIRQGRADTPTVVATVFYETLTMMAVGAALSLVILVGLVPHELLLIGLAALVLLATGVPTLPPVFARLARLGGVGKRQAEQAERLNRLNYATLVRGWAAIAGGWVLLGLSLWATLEGLGFTSGAWSWHDQALNTAAVGLAVVLGFLSLIPGGAVVRELVLMQLLAPRLGTQGEVKALVAALVLRVVWLVAEAVLSAILYVLGAPAAARAGQGTDETAAADDAHEERVGENPPASG